VTHIGRYCLSLSGLSVCSPAVAWRRTAVLPSPTAYVSYNYNSRVVNQRTDRQRPLQTSVCLVRPSVRRLWPAVSIQLHEGGDAKVCCCLPFINSTVVVRRPTSAAIINGRLVRPSVHRQRAGRCDATFDERINAASTVITTANHLSGLLSVRPL
jgi:hypothetical protein